MTGNIVVGNFQQNRHWVEPAHGWICESNCEPFGEVEGACINPGCDGTEALVLYAHHDDPDWRCRHGDRLCPDCGPVIVAFACKTCGLVQDPEPPETPEGQLGLFPNL